jgi:predicted HTH transcriptional regulator
VNRFSPTYVRQQKLLGAEQLAEIRRLVAEGKTNKEIAEILGVCTKTVERKITKIMNELAGKNVSQVQLWRDELIEELYDARLEVEASREPGKPLSAKLVNTLLGIIALDAKLKGAFAPERSITAHVEVNTTVQYQFLEHAHGLSQEQIEEVFRFMDSLPRKQTTIDLTGFAEPKALPAPEVTNEKTI